MDRQCVTRQWANKSWLPFSQLFLLFLMAPIGLSVQLTSEGNNESIDQLETQWLCSDILH